MIRSITFTFALTACVATTAQYTEARFGEPRPPRPDSCDIQWLSINESPANGRDQVAMLSNVPVGPDPSSPAARDKVRRRACALGGDAASLVVSANDYAAYIVWAKTR